MEEVNPIEKKMGFSVSTDLTDITRVDYYLNGKLIGSKLSEKDILEYTFWSGGEYDLAAKIYHSGGSLASVVSQTLNIEWETCELPITVGPNPTREFIRLYVPYLSSFQYQIISLNGHILEHGVSGNNFMKIYCSTWPPGVYVLTVRENHCTYTKKIIKID